MSPYFIYNIAVGLFFMSTVHQTYGSIVCYSCTNATHPDECIFIQKCADNEMCFVESRSYSDGRVIYNIGCKPKQQCPGIIPPRLVGKRISGTTLCNVCCGEDYCNADLCDHHYSHVTQGPRCLNCDNVLNIQDCLKMKRCELNEICYAQSRQSGYKLGCVRKADCSHTLLSGTFVGKRATPTTSCQECCEEENCNSHLCSRITAGYKLMIDKVVENKSNCDDNSYQSCQYMINVLKAQCSDRNIQALCPKSCGLCDMDACQDNMTFNCAEVSRYFNVCTSINAYKYCRKYCNLCRSPLIIGLPTDCLALEIRGNKSSGVYKIYPDMLAFPNGILVYCDMNFFGGGWTVIQRRINGSLDFNNTWQEYKDGFGDPNGEYWLGNEALHALTKGKNITLLIRLLDRSKGSEWKFAQYRGMHVENEATNYTLTFTKGSYSGTAGNQLNVYGPGNHYNMSFSTYDSDSDKSSRNCASLLEGGWWFNNCEHGCLNCAYLAKDSNWGPINFKSSYMMIR